MLTIDGSMGEGGGQILRSALALSLLTGRPFRIAGIRAGRSRPGLMRQHLVAVNAATEVGAAHVQGAEIGSTELDFEPSGIRGGGYTFAIGGAGSTTLVFQTVLFPLLLGAREPSTLNFEGGTHNPMAPPYDFLELTFLPLLARMGARVDTVFFRHGFYPAGGGKWSATVFPSASLERFTLLERGEILDRRASALVAQLPPAVALRELEALANALAWDRAACRPSMIQRSHGPGNALLAVVASENITEVITGYGERGVPAEAIGAGVARETARYLAANVPVGEHLADQLLLPLALGQGGVFRTVRPTPHFHSQVALLQTFLEVSVSAIEEAPDVWRIDVPGRRS
jgi:RNA 3'-terminal phosphate cyclase (ATP)